MVGRRLSREVTSEDSSSYLAAVKEAFHDEPAKYDEFINLLNDFNAHRVDVASTVAKVEELMKDHQKLLLGLNVFLQAEAKRAIVPEAKTALKLPEGVIVPKAKRTIPPEAKRAVAQKVEQQAESSYNKRKRAEIDGEEFMKKLKTRFKTLDTHVVGSFQEIMQMWKEGKMSVKKVHEEVIDLLYYHEDLIEDFSKFLPKE